MYTAKNLVVGLAKSGVISRLEITEDRCRYCQWFVCWIHVSGDTRENNIMM